ncbi:hypothetical protein WL92_01055 [Burkholderia multivorans]|nr:hypothetical protein WL91_19290 [Burkholderia multivorans]KWF83285.1 hypothetical protein WL92_01055 [Burkholderia multivorans]
MLRAARGAVGDGTRAADATKRAATQRSVECATRLRVRHVALRRAPRSRACCACCAAEPTCGPNVQRARIAAMTRRFVAE